VAVIRIFLDTNAYAAFKKGDADTAQVIRYADIIGVSVVVLGELLAGFTGGTKEKVNRRELDAFLDSPRVRVYPVDAETTAHYALIYNQLKRKGRPIPTNDLWIAASCMQWGFRLLTSDPHFSEIDGLLTGQFAVDFLP
jgi:predicted nucleic acid-binding protein